MYSTKVVTSLTPSPFNIIFSLLYYILPRLISASIRLIINARPRAPLDLLLETTYTIPKALAAEKMAIVSLILKVIIKIIIKTIKD